MPRKAKKRTLKSTVKSIGRDALSLVPGVSTVTGAHSLAKKYAPSQSSVNRFLRGNPDPDFPEFATSTGHIRFEDHGSIEVFMRDGWVYRAYTSTPVFDDGYRMGVPEESVSEFAQENPAKFDRCVKDVQASLKRYGRPGNAYAICSAAGTRNPRRNPESGADAVYEDFHGAPPSETLEITEEFHAHANLGGLGDLVEIEVKLAGGKNAGQTFLLKAPDPNTSDEDEIVRVASNEQRNQLYLVGGNQSIDVEKLGFRSSFDVKHDGEVFEATEIKDHMIIGEIHRLTYQTEKSFDKFKTIDYFHKVGEDTKVRPFLTYDTRSAHMGIVGGQYTIHERGIVN